MSCTPVNLQILLFSIILALGCVKRTTPSKPIEQESGGQPADSTAMHPTASTSTPQNMIPVKVSVGQTIQIQFDDHPMPDYTWYYAVSEDWVISMTEPYDYPSKSANPNKKDATESAKNEKVFDVKGLKKGTVTIRFYKIRAWEPKEKPAEERFYRVEVGE